MIDEYLRYRIDASRQVEFISAYRAAAEPLMASPYCVRFDLSQCVEDPAEFILRIEWTSPEDHMERFRQSPEFRAFFVHIRPFLKDISEMRHYSRLIGG